MNPQTLRKLETVAELDMTDTVPREKRAPSCRKTRASRRKHGVLCWALLQAGKAV